MDFNLSVYLSGLTVAIGLIVAIGPQNAYLLKQGIARAHVASVVMVCVLSDIALISLGVAGLGKFIAQSPMLIQVATWGGAGFLLLYGLRAFYAALHPGALETSGSIQTQWRGAVLTGLAFTFLNPYVYLDTVVLMGSVSGQFATARFSFWLGCITASSAWFVVLGVFASQLAPLFAKPSSWRVLDCIVGVIMCATAWHLISQFG